MSNKIRIAYITYFRHSAFLVHTVVSDHMGTLISIVDLQMIDFKACCDLGIGFFH